MLQCSRFPSTFHVSLLLSSASPEPLLLCVKSCEGLWGDQCKAIDDKDRIRKSGDEMDHGHAMQMESPFVMPHEDIEALHSSQAFCVLRGHLAGDAEYVP
jgi:hypothetical protein